MDKSNIAANNNNNQQQPDPQPQDKRNQALPAPGDGTGNGVTTIDMSGGDTTVKLDALGPLVVNEDGTMSRISNWTEMAEIEKKNTLRILGKRNKQRLEALKKKMADTPDN